MKLTLSPFNITLTIIAIIVIYFALIHKTDNSELNLYKKDYQAKIDSVLAKLSKDSIKYTNEIKVSEKVQDSIKLHYNNQALQLQQTIATYEKKKYYPQTAPIVVVNNQLDSILRAIKDKYRHK